MAKKQRVPGWHSMRKDQLIRALVKAAKQKAGESLERPKKRPDSQVRKRMSQIQAVLDRVKNLGTTTPNGREVKDRLVVMVRDPYWLHAYWELRPASIDRARAALAQAWHAAKPILRLLMIGDDGATAVERDIEIHGGVNNWYVDVQEPPSSYRLEIGYRTHTGTFYCLARSNAVTTPPAGTSDAVDENWADVAENADRIFAMSGGYSPHGTSQELQELLEERLRRPMGSPMKTRFGTGAMSKEADDALSFAVDSELIVYGVVERDAHVTLQGEPVQLRPDGTFTVRLNMPDRRQVIPVVASSADGTEQRTIVLAVERNTKVMEPVIRDVAR